MQTLKIILGITILVIGLIIFSIGIANIIFGLQGGWIIGKL